MTRYAHPILVTGGAGFIGSNFVLHWLAQNKGPVVNFDLLTYAGNLGNLASLEGNPDHVLVRGDINDRPQVDRVLSEHRPSAIVHFAAESHVDRSILGPEAFLRTNVYGTFHLLEAARTYVAGLEGEEKAAFRFLHVSTDEVYGTLGPDDPPFHEDTPFAPNSPYAASKAASDHLVRAWVHTYKLPAIITNCSNNYGPLQFPEKVAAADDQQCACRQAVADLRRWTPGARLAVRSLTTAALSNPCSKREGPARPTTSEAATSRPTSTLFTWSASCSMNSCPTHRTHRTTS